MVIIMFQSFISLHPIFQAFLAGMLTFFITSLGSATVFFFKSVNKNIMDSMLSISAGIMLAASYFSLLNPAIERAEDLGFVVWATVLIGFISGAIVLFLGDKFLAYFSKTNKKEITKFKRCIMLFFSITLHNIPEGLVLGVAFGSIPFTNDKAAIFAAISLTIGIAIQNFPEGSAISLPLRREGLSRWQSFIFGVASGIVEPISAIIGALLVLNIQTILPFVLCFTAGAMVFVTVMELIPESQANNKKGLMALFLIAGFALMMTLEIVLG